MINPGLMNRTVKLRRNQIWQRATERVAEFGTGAKWPVATTRSCLIETDRMKGVEKKRCGVVCGTNEPVGSRSDTDDRHVRQ